MLDKIAHSKAAPFLILFITGFILFLTYYLDDTAPLGVGHYSVLSWSPDSTKVLLEFGLDEPWIYDITTGKYSELKLPQSHSYRWGYTSWPSENTLILETEVRFYSPQLSEVNIVTGEIREFPVLPSELTEFSVNPVNHSLVYASNHDNREVFCLYLWMRDETSTSKFGECTTQVEGSPSWPPDGNFLASSYRDGIIIRNVDGREYKRLDVNLSGRGGLAWSSDSRTIMFQGYNDFDHGLFLIAVEGDKSAELIHTDSEGIARFAWSPDNRFVAYSTVGVPGRNRFYVKSFDDLRK